MIGKILFDKYRIERLLGNGGMGQVFLGTHLGLGNKWAIKKISSRIGRSEAEFNEEKTLKLLNHTNIPQVIDIFRDDNCTYIVETYIEGRTLENILKEHGKLPEQQIIEWSLQLCDALEYLHNLKPWAVIYRDMKPSNVMITNDNKAMLIDFGAAMLYNGHHTPDAFIVGTSSYAAPEQMIIGGASDARTDIYGLGATMYHLVTGEMNNNKSLEKSSSGIKANKNLMRIIYKCIERDKEKRYYTIAELREELRALYDKNIAKAIRDESSVKALAITIGIMSIITFVTTLIGLLIN